MALSKSILVPGTDWVLTYHRIADIRYSANSHMRVTIYSYPDEGTRRADNHPVPPHPNASIALVTTSPVEETYTETVKDVDGNIESTETKTRTVPGDPVYVEDGIPAGNIMEIAYALLKKQPEWADAVDC